jgi:hypothetical protein
MKPLSEWTDAELRKELQAATTYYYVYDLLAELLRRERERCEKVCDSVVVDMETMPDGYRASLAAGICAARIRELT